MASAFALIVRSMKESTIDKNPGLAKLAKLPLWVPGGKYRPPYVSTFILLACQ
jgi:hypothetical protein